MCPFHPTLLLTHACIHMPVHHTCAHTRKLQHKAWQILLKEIKRIPHSHTSTERQSWYPASTLVLKLLPFLFPYTFSFFLILKIITPLTSFHFLKCFHISCYLWQSQLLWKVGQVVLFSLCYKIWNLAYNISQWKEENISKRKHPSSFDSVSISMYFSLKLL